MSVTASTKEHEGFSETPYPDKYGLWTFGYGRCLETNPLTGTEWDYLLSNKLIEVRITQSGAFLIMQKQLEEARNLISRKFSWFANLGTIRQDILVEMAYQLGHRFFTFEDMFESLAKYDFAEAARHGLNSKWAKKDSPSRAREMMRILERGA